MPKEQKKKRKREKKKYADAQMCQVHRCRFIDWKPHAVVCLSFNVDGSRLAVGRENGDIEVWNVAAGWVCERVVPGSGEATVQSVLWHRQRGQDRLITAGLNGLLIDWDLLRLEPKYSSDSFGGAVWSACSRAVTTSKADEDEWQVGLACEDGSVRLFEAGEDEQSPQYVKSLVGHTGRVLCVDWRDDILVSGGADSNVIVWNTTDCSQRACILVDTSKLEPTVVWSVKLLADWTVVSGDSRGHVSFWDGEFGTLLQTFSQHRSDVLALASLDGGRRVYASGVDSQIAEFNYVTYTSGEGKWVLSSSQRSHTHDVLAIAATSAPSASRTLTKADEKDSSGQPNMGLVVSGGIDTQFCVYSGNFRQRPKKVMPFTCSLPVAIAPLAPEANGDKTILFLVQVEKTLQLWRLAGVQEEAIAAKAKPGGYVEGGTHQPLLDIQTSAPGQGLSLTCSALSNDGAWVVASSPSALKLYHLTWPENVRDVPPRVKYVKTPLPPSSRVCFVPNNDHVVAAGLDGVVRVLNLTEGDVVASFDQHAGEEDEEEELAEEKPGGLIQTLITSQDGRWLASGDHLNRIHVFDLHKLQHHCALPVGSSPHTALSFEPSAAMLVVVYADNEVCEFDLIQKRLSDWSRANNKCLPSNLKSSDKIFQVTFDPSRPRYMLLIARGYMCHLNMDAAARKPSSAKHSKVAEDSSAGAASSNPENCRIVTRFKPLLAGGFVSDSRLLLVEVPWIRVMQGFQPALYRQKYGT